SVVVKKWGTGSGQSFVQSDSAFTGIVYGLGSVESYGYNVGTLVKNLNSTPGIVNILSSGGASANYTCRNTPFRFTIQLTVKPTQMVWQFSQVPGLSPNVDSVQNNPVPVDSSLINGRWYYYYTVNQDFTYSNIGTFTLPILITHPSIEGCNNSYERLLNVDVVEAPSADFTIDFDGCLDDVVQFNGTGASVVPGVTVAAYNWNFGDNNTATNIQNPTHQYTAAGNYDVRMDLVTSDGCLGQVTKPLVVTAAPEPVFVQDTVAVCPDEDATLQVQNPVTGVTYSWYNAETGGTLLHTGTSYTLNVVATTSVWVESSQAGCRSQGRTRAVLIIQPAVASPVVTVTERTPTTLTFTWNAVANATGYEVSTNGGTTWVQPSSGAMGTTHTITGLAPLTSVTLIVRALGGCEEARSPAVTAQTLTDKIFIPNSFTPNGDGNNDVLLVYGYTIREIQFMVFNQWGQKIFESRSQTTGWDGTHKGKVQPAGVYMYVARITLTDGTVMDQKGTINLVR
ncbi:MAG TPA: gliding motility-associated C-terminal domain-containing protein, partial [Chitinophagaceae bacterium]